MTEDYKDLLLKYLTGNLTDDYDESNITPYYENVEYQVKSNTEVIPTGIGIKCVDGTGKLNGKTLYYAPNGTSSLYLVDGDMNILNIYTSWNTGTDFNKFLRLDVDEEGQFYGIDYNESTGKYRFILLNNLSEPIKMPDGSLEYRAILRNSYFIQGYTDDDDITPNFPVYLAKSKQGATYYFAFFDSLGATLMPSLLTINVGAPNEWLRLSDILIGQGYILDYIIYFNTENTPHASYFYKDDNLDVISRIDIVGEDEPTYTTLINLYDVRTSLSNVISEYPGNSNELEYDLISLGKEQYYFVIRGYVGLGSSSQGVQFIIVYKNYENINNYIWLLYEDRGVVGSENIRVPKTEYAKTDNGDLCMFYRLMDDEDDIYDDLSFDFIANNPEYPMSGSFQYNVTTTTKIMRILNQRLLLSNTFNLFKVICQTNNYGESTITNTIVSFIYNSDNYNCLPFESNGEDKRVLVPNQGILFDTNNKPIFARNLYNNKTYGNKSVSILNVPNNMLNDTSIYSNELISTFNNPLVDNDNLIEKNIYEDLYINYFNTITMQDRNNSYYRENVEGATRVNQSSNKITDYEDAKASKIKITYDDGTYIIGGVGNTINNGVVTYEFYMYVPDGKTIEKVDIISEDEQTIYQTIDYFPESLLTTKTYKVQQDVRVE